MLTKEARPALIMPEEDFDFVRYVAYLRKLSLQILLGQTARNAFWNLVSRFPQMAGGRIDYLLASGLAIDFFAGEERHHRDIDLVMVNGLLVKNKHLRRIDVRRSDLFWNGLSFSDGYLKSTAQRVLVREGDVLIVHPAILLVQKLGNKGSLPPREKDWRDIELLIDRFSSLPETEKENWRRVVVFSLSSFSDRNMEQVVRERISGFLPSII